MLLIGLVNRRDEDWLRKQPEATECIRWFSRVKDFTYSFYSLSDSSNQLSAVVCSDTMFRELYRSIPAAGQRREKLAGRIIVLRTFHDSVDFEQEMEASGLVLGWLNQPFDSSRLSTLIKSLEHLKDQHNHTVDEGLNDFHRKARLQRLFIERLRKLKRRIENTEDFPAICRMIVESAREITESETGMIIAPGRSSIFLADCGTCKLETGMPENLLENSDLPFNHIVLNRETFLQQPYRLRQPAEYIEGLPELRGMAAVPISENNKSVGILAVGNNTNGGYSHQTIESLNQLAEIGSLALERHHAGLQLNRARSELNRAYNDLNLTCQDLQKHVVVVDQLQNIEQRIQAASNLRLILRELVEGAHHLLDCEFCMIAFRESQEQDYSYYTNHETCQLFLESSVKNPLASIPQFSDPEKLSDSYLDNNPSEEVVRVLRPFQVELRNILAVHLAHDKQSLGFLVGFNKKGQGFGPTDRYLIRALAGTATTAIMNSSLARRFKGLFEQSVKALSNAIEARDHYTRGHTDRVSSYVQAMCRELGWGQQALEQAYIGTLLHDIGKIGIPDSILSKPAQLVPDEYATMREHVMIGVRIVRDIPQLEAVTGFIKHHHERFDGRGYPDGLRGKGIPPAGRITAVADSFDAMTSDRPYRRAMTPEQAAAELRKNSGTQFDPAMVTIFLRLLEKGAFERDLCRTHIVTEQWIAFDAFMTADVRLVG